MTPQPDDRQPDEGADGRARLDEDAAWRAIVANYGDRAEMGPEDTTSPSDPDTVEGDPPEGEQPAPAGGPGPRNLFDRTYLDSLNSEATWDDEGHFVPPDPPPVPRATPRRRAAWIGLFGSPALMLLAVILSWHYPNWVSVILVGSFVGGFLYLVGTMPRNGGDGWSGDDGAVV